MIWNLNKYVVVVAAAVLAAGACSAAPVDATKEKRQQEQRDAQLIEAAKKAIAYSLIDPDSAKFREIFVAPNRAAVCGQVNAKNRMGGYTGFQRFMYSPTKQGIDGDGSYFVEARWDDRCVNGVIQADDKP